MLRLHGALSALLLALATGALLSGKHNVPDRASSSQGHASGGSGGSGGSDACEAASSGLPAVGSCAQAEQLAGKQEQQPNAPSHGGWSSRPAGGGLHIVRFRNYQMAAQHRSALEAALAGAAPAGAWEWVERRNKAAAYPTDFGLLRLAADGEAELRTCLEQLHFVRDVHPERQITRSLLAEAGPEAVALRHQGSLAAAPCGGTEQQQQHQQQDDVVCATKRPGRLQTRPTFDLEDNRGDDAGSAGSARVANDTFSARASAARRRRLQQAPGQTLASILQADQIWAQGFRGQGVKMGVFDTGIRGDHPDVKHIVERTNWTHEPTLDDGLGHGSFVAGVISGTDPACPGLAPEVELHTFRVFTNDQVSYTSWFLDAFNYAMATKMNIVNLSIGGPDYLDLPFVEKVAEITSSGIIMVSAIGNDGPLYGTLNNPADQNDVIGIGGIDYTDSIAPFSSRGMSTWEIPLGYGRSKPDVMAYGRDVQGSRIAGGCRSLSGTSVASPVVAGAVCLLSSVVPEDKRWKILNPASMKQALVEGAIRLPGLNLYEQGAGKLSVVNSKTILDRYIPRASLVPRKLDFTDCPYMWPFCRQALYAGAMPLMFNATILNGQGLTGALEGPPEWTPADEGGRLLDVQFEYSEQLWPWSGYLAVYLRVKPEGATFEGRATGEFKFVVQSPPAKGEKLPRRSFVHVPLAVNIMPTPPRSQRVLWDQFHSIRYPPAYFPRDDLQVRHDILDWHGDHPHTNFHDVYDMLRDEGFFLEVLASPATCFNASNYGSLLIVDSEDEFYPEEVAKLAADVEQLGMGLLIFADWYHVESIQKLRFFDDNTRSWWEAATGGANVPALNDLLVPFGAAFESGALESQVSIEGLPGQGTFHMASGVPIKALPAGAWLHRTPAKQKEGQPPKPGQGVLGLFQHGAGRVGLYGDSNCLDSSHSRSKCFKLLKHLLRWAGGEDVPALTAPAALQAKPYGTFEGMPARRPDFNFSEISPVLQTPLRCYPNSPPEFQGATFEQWKVPVSRPARQPVAAEQQPQQPPPAEGGAATGQAGSVPQEQPQPQGNGTADPQQQQPQPQGNGSADSQQQQQQLQPQPQDNGTADPQQQQPQPQGNGSADSQQQQQQLQPQPQDNGTADPQQQQQHPSGGTADPQQQPGGGTADPQQQSQQHQQQQQAASNQTASEGTASAQAAASKAAEAEKAAAAQKAAEQEELRKQQEALQRKAEEEARKQKEEAAAAAAAAAKKAAEDAAKAVQEQQQQAGGGGAAGGAAAGADSGGSSVDGREHPDISTLAQAGEEGPQQVEDHSRPKQAADPQPTGEGAAARTSSLMHQKTAAATIAGSTGGGSSYTQSLLLEGGLLCGIAATVLWSRSRRRRGLPLRLGLGGRRRLLPLWGNSEARGRIE